MPFFFGGGCWFFRCVCETFQTLVYRDSQEKLAKLFECFFFSVSPEAFRRSQNNIREPLVVLLLYYNPWWSYKHTTRNCEDFMKVCWSFGFRFNSPRFHTPQFGDDPIIKISTQTEAHCTISSDLGHWWILIFWILGLRVGLYVVDARKCLVLQFGLALLFYCTDFPAPPQNGSFLGKGTKNSLISMKSRLVKYYNLARYHQLQLQLQRALEVEKVVAALGLSWLFVIKKGKE